jgi:serine/threonine-protein kinase
MKVHEAFLLMELFDGRPMDVRPPSTVLESTNIFLQAAQGLKALHAMGYAHCDLKPNNILTNDKGQVKVIDFGQACRIGTVKVRIQGTPDYIAPEQVARQPVTVQTDIFNFGATMYWALTGTVIPTLYTVKKKGANSFLLHGAIRAPIELNPKVPPALSKLTMECIETRVSERPPDLENVIMRLELSKHVLLRNAGIAPPVDPSLEIGPDDSRIGQSR